MMEINCILCTDVNNGISLNNDIPWNISEEFKYFNSVTTVLDPMCFGSKKHAVLMGKNTYNSIKMTHLPNRYNYVLTNSVITNQHELLVVSDNLNNIMDDICDKYKMGIIDKLFIIGGKAIYEHFVNNSLVKHIYLTKIDKDFCCDNVVNFNFDKYNLICNNTRTMHDKTTDMSLNLTFMKYENKNYVDSKYWTYVNKMPFINFEELQYINIMSKILKDGHYRKTRNANTYSIFGAHMVFDLQNGTLPLLTTKKMFTRGILEELLFFLRGETNSKILENMNVNIWKPNTSREFLNTMSEKVANYADGDMGPMYGFQLRHFGANYKGCDKMYMNEGIDQFAQVIYDLEHDKYSRRILMTTYNPVQANEGVLYPCHGLTIQFGIENDNLLCCHMYQRSSDFFLGESFNIASYGFLVHIMCNILNTKNIDLKPGKLYMSIGDVHLYENHIDVAMEQIKNTPYMFPKLKIKKNIVDINDITSQDFEILDYISHQKLNAVMVA